MLSNISSRLAIAALIAAALSPMYPRAQSQDSQTQSVAEAARRAREQKKAAATKPAPVITDDILKPSAPAAQGANAPVPSPETAPSPATSSAAQPSGTPASAPDAGAAPAPAEQRASGSPAATADQKTTESAEVTALKQQLAEAQKALDLLQRDAALQQDTYISNPDHAHDTAGKAKLDAMLQQIAGSRETVDALKAQLAALLASAGSIAPTPPAAPPQP